MSSVSAITQFSSAIQSSQTQNQIAIAVAKKQLDAVKAQGNAAVELLQQAAKSNQRLDVKG
jgi:hypothetical protein